MDAKAYQKLEQAFVDVVRVGVAGNGAGVRQLANRVLKTLPSDSSDSDTLRSRLADAMVGKSDSPKFRSVAQATPVLESTLVHWSYPTLEELPNLVLSGVPATLADQLIAQWSDRGRLEAAGLSAANTVLLTGPPGVGKTLLAHHIAARLQLPLATVNLAEVISSLLGGTGKNLRDAMEAARQVESVLLMDEFDAVAKRRDDSSDIGELKRIVNVMLLELDQWPSDRLLVAATNHPQLLDSAVSRRFEMSIELDLLGVDLREGIVKKLLDGTGCSPWVAGLVAEVSAERSPADIERLVRSARREAFTDEVPLERTLVSASLRTCGNGAGRDAAIGELKQRWKISNREIARIFGISHPTVANALERVARKDAK